MKSVLLFFTQLALLFSRVNSAQWPSYPTDELEGVLFSGENEGRIDIKSLNKCQKQYEYRSVPAEWVLTAYHDMATHNVDDGTGGLDGSIVFETYRVENIGAAFPNTFNGLSPSMNKYVSFSDALAMGVVLAVAECGGPIIPYRGGRIDAKKEGVAGVPQSEQPLDHHVESFRRQGYTPEGMIAMIACGHTLGGVHHDDFPDLVDPSPTTGKDFLQTFDTTPAFDNAIVTEYLAGKSIDPLISHPNTVRLSDARIFNWDQNKTVKGFKNPKNFDKSCQSVLEQMINTVPKNVKLTDIINPIPVKVERTYLSLESQSIVLHTSLRLLTNNPNRKVTIFWTDGDGKRVRSAPSTGTVDVSATLTRRLGYSPVRYLFTPTIAVSDSISKFWFVVDEGRGQRTTTYNNDGDGYQIQQDSIILSTQRSSKRNNQFNVAVAVRNNPVPTRVFASTLEFPQGNVTSITSTVDFTLDRSAPSVPGYSFYKGTLKGKQFSFDLSAVAHGKTTTAEFLQSSYISN